MLHAYRNPVRVFELDEGFTLIVGPSGSAMLLEVGVVDGGVDERRAGPVGHVECSITSPRGEAQGLAGSAGRPLFWQGVVPPLRDAPRTPGGAGHPRALPLLATTPPLMLALLAGLGWLAIAWLFTPYWPPRFNAAVFCVLVLAAWLTRPGTAG